jgi:hypothetical protein
MTPRGEPHQAAPAAEGSSGARTGRDAAPDLVRHAALDAPSIALPTPIVPLRYDSLDDRSATNGTSKRMVTFGDDGIDIDLEITLDEKRRLVGRITPRPEWAEIRSTADTLPVDLADSGDFVVEGLMRGPITVVVSGAVECHTEWVVI